MTPLVDLNDATPEKALVKEFMRDDYRFHQFSDGSFLVFKDVDNDPSYEIDSQFGCNCPSATYRSKTCKHERLAGFLRGSSEDNVEGEQVEIAMGSSDTTSLLEDLLE